MLCYRIDLAVIKEVHRFVSIAILILVDPFLGPQVFHQLFFVQLINLNNFPFLIPVLTLTHIHFYYLS